MFAPRPDASASRPGPRSGVGCRAAAGIGAGSSDYRRHPVRGAPPAVGAESSPPEAPAVPAPAVSVPDNPAAEFAAAAEPEPEPEPALEGAAAGPGDPDQHGRDVGGGSRPRIGGAKAPKEKGAKGLRLKRSNNAAGLEVVGAAAVVETAADPAAAIDVLLPRRPTSPSPSAPSARRFASAARRRRSPRTSRRAGSPSWPRSPEAPTAPASDGGFGAVAPAPTAPHLRASLPAPQSAGDPNAGFGTDSGFGGQAGFGSPAPAPSGWQEQAPGKKKRGIRLPSTSGKFGRPTLIILVVLALLVAALAYMFLGRGGGAGQPAYALDFAAGQTYNYKMTMALNGQLTLAGRNVPLEENMGATMTWNVQSVDANGVATVDVQLGDPQITVNGKSMPAGQLPESSSHYTMRVAKDGSILSGGGFGAMSGGSSSPTGEVPGTDQLTPLLPGHDVNPGDTWDKAFDSDLPYGMGHVHFVTHSTYVKNEDVNGVTTSVIASKMSMPLHMKVDLLKMMKSMGSSTAGLPAGSHRDRLRRPRERHDDGVVRPDHTADAEDLGRGAVQDGDGVPRPSAGGASRREHDGVPRRDHRESPAGLDPRSPLAGRRLLGAPCAEASDHPPHDPGQDDHADDDGDR